MLDILSERSHAEQQELIPQALLEKQRPGAGLSSLSFASLL